MSISWISRFPRTALLGFQQLGAWPSCASPISPASAPKGLDCRKIWSWPQPTGRKIRCKSSFALELALKDNVSREQVDPFSLVASECSLVADRLRTMVHSEVPELSSAAEYFFGSGAKGKKIRLTVLLLMAKSFDLSALASPFQFRESSMAELPERQRFMAGITEIIHVASLIHDDVLDEANTRRGVGSLNSVKGNKLAILAGDFVLSRAFAALASLMNTEVVTLLATAVDNLIRGETMQITASSDKCYSMEFYMQKTYYKTASLISNSCKAIAVLSGQTADVSELAFEYGKNLGLAFQLIDDVLDFTGSPATLGKPSLSDIKLGIITAPMLFAMEEFPQLREIIDKGLSDTRNLDKALEYLSESNGIQRTRELAMKHSELAEAAIQSLPKTMDSDTAKARQALTDVTQIVLTREK